MAKLNNFASKNVVSGFMRRHCPNVNRVNSEFIQAFTDIIILYANNACTIDISLQNVIKSDDAKQISSQNHEATSNYLYEIARNLHFNSQGISFKENLKIGYIVSNTHNMMVMPMTIVKVKFDEKSKKNTKIFIMDRSEESPGPPELVYGWVSICNKQLCPKQYVSNDWSDRLCAYFDRCGYGCSVPTGKKIDICQWNFNSCSNVIVLDSFNACIREKIYKTITVERCKNECRYKPSICTHFGLIGLSNKEYNKYSYYGSNPSNHSRATRRAWTEKNIKEWIDNFVGTYNSHKRIDCSEFFMVSGYVDDIVNECNIAEIQYDAMKGLFKYRGDVKYDKLNIEMKDGKCTITIYTIFDNDSCKQRLKCDRCMRLTNGKYFIFVRYNYCECILKRKMSLTIRKT